METIGLSVCGREIGAYKIGNGKYKLLIAGGFHANEWITSEVLRAFHERLCRAIRWGGCICDVDLEELCKLLTLYIIPEINPDGIALVQGRGREGEYAAASEIAARYPDIPFPDGWKANIRGVDLNLNFPAGWLTAKKIKADLGFNSPAPRDYPGDGPLSEPEAAVLAEYTEKIRPDMILAFHTQGRVIYWKYIDIDIPGAWETASQMAKASGYEAEETPYASGHAGFKDWFIQEFGKQGFTIEAGEGENPLPIRDFPKVYKECESIIISAANAFKPG